VWALGHTRSREAATSVARLTGDREPRVRRAVARALGRLEDASSVPALTRLLASDPDPGVRRAAAWALGKFD
jgi:HEAT repeat protein